jgi:hypothetical protein
VRLASIYILYNLKYYILDVYIYRHIHMYIYEAHRGEARQLDRLYVDLSQDNTILVLYECTD